MPNTGQSSYLVMTLSEWMVHSDSDFKGVIEPLCTIFGLPDQAAVELYLEEEINLQGRLLLFVDRTEIVAVAGWRWPNHGDHVSAYLGIRRTAHDPFLRHELVAMVIARLEEERMRSHHADITFLLLQYSPVDRQMGLACRELGCTWYRYRNTFFRKHLNARWSLRSMYLPFGSISSRSP